ncbi:hypothetical protein [Lacimicrobium alkaliphilum]|uniref:Uncharacterized protein n=1 Tax=Lacimicrobium alkaliphilum TaxID=1526571 RepID=A0A0U2QJ98_9ALTE|nr:hypothetical protein [Lacimicrobium alkaliphilum]ALS97099.1 hypothetical protein AT746_01585 [Lacimicrobium alkaliphilum]
MISFEKWQTRVADEIQVESNNLRYSCAFYCPTESIDNRTIWSESYIKTRSHVLTSAVYDRDSVSINIANEDYSINNLSDFNLPEGRVLVDATSLQVPELLHILRMLDAKSRNFDVMYVQPTAYTEKKTNAIGVYSFDLSDDGPGAEYLPPYVNYSFDSTLFVCLGYEGHRFGALINSESFSTNYTKGLIGVPPFAVGMEYKSLSANYEHILSTVSSPDSSFSVCGANDPLKAYSFIEQAHRSASYDRRPFSVAPLGTKPVALATLVYAVNNKGVSLVYDFVRKKKGRSSGKDIVHMWSMKVTPTPE